MKLIICDGTKIDCGKVININYNILTEHSVISALFIHDKLMILER